MPKVSVTRSHPALAGGVTVVTPLTLEGVDSKAVQ